MNDRCRVFALNGEELFPCRWAKAKKLVAANVAKKATVDGKMCIKMLEPTRMNKPQEAIMDNEISNEVSNKVNNEVGFIFPETLFKYCILKSKFLSGYSIYEFNLYKVESETSAMYTVKGESYAITQQIIHSVCSCEINANFLGDFYPFRTSLSDAEKDLDMHINKLNIIKSSISKISNEKKETRCIAIDSGKYNVCDEPLERIDLNAKEVFVNGNLVAQEDGFLFPDLLYQYAPNFGAIVVLKLDGYKTNKVGTYYYSKGDKSTDGMGPENINKDMISDDNISNWNFRLDNWPFRTKLSLAIEDFENQRICDIKRFEDKLQLLRSNSVPKIIG